MFYINFISSVILFLYTSLLIIFYVIHWFIHPIPHSLSVGTPPAASPHPAL